MSILALDTSSALSSVALLDGDDIVVERSHHDPRRHVEEIGPLLDTVCAVLDPAELEAVVCGVGPGPYTGLRVAIAAGLALGAVWRVPVVGVCSLDAVAAAARSRGVTMPVAVALDARRREVYWTAYDAAGTRIAGPRVGPVADIDESVRTGTWVGAGAALYAEQLGPVVEDPETTYPRASWLARVAADALAAGARVELDPVVLDAHGADSGATASALLGRVLLAPRPLYVRRPDVTVPGGAA